MNKNDPRYIAAENKIMDAVFDSIEDRVSDELYPHTVF